MLAAVVAAQNGGSDR